MARVVVIGAGIAGASVAYHLAAAGADVVVVDDAQPGRATSAGAGIVSPVRIRPVSDVKSQFAFSATAHYLDLVERFEKSGLKDHSYGATGELIVALDNDELRRLNDVADQAESLTGRYGTPGVGVPVLLGRAELEQRFPLLSTAIGALWLPEVARIDGRVIRDLLMTMATRHGARVIDGRGEIVMSGSKVVGARTATDRFECDHVVVAAGAWSGAVASAAGIDLAVYPQRGQILHLRLPEGSTLPVISAFRGIYLLSFPGDRVVIGATREDDSGFVNHATAGGIDMLIRSALSVVPRLTHAEWLEVRIGTRPASRDGEPFIGPAPGVDGLWLATGFGPQGLHLAPYSGRLVAASVLGEPAEIPGIFAAGRNIGTES